MPQGQTFRAQVDLVVVDVTVLSRGTPVSGLNAADFRVLDDGVPQQVEFLSTDAIPIDVALVVDTAGTIGGVNPLRFWDDVNTVANLLRPGDRLALATVTTAVREELPLQSVPVQVPRQPITVGGGWPVFDALLQAMLRPGAAGRRHLILDWTEGVDTLSVSSPARVLDVAKRCDAMVFIALPNRSRSGIHSLLEEVAHATGGDVLKASDIPSAFRRVLAALERSYVLTYTPRGVSREGWHDVTVSLNRPGTYTVRARRGYFAGSPPRDSWRLVKTGRGPSR
jgi:hypothetical protein